MSERTIRNKVEKLKKLEEQKKALEKEMDTLKDQIKAEMQNRDAEELPAGEHTVRFTTMTTNRFNSKAFQAEHPRLYKKYLQGKETRRFSIA